MEEHIEVEGKILTVLAGTMFRVELDNKHQVLATISGKMRKRFVRLTVGDRVKMQMSQYDLNKARIVWRIGENFAAQFLQMNAAILVAAGKGARMGADKLFLEIAGRPVIVHTWKNFNDAKCVDEIILVARDGTQEKF